MVTGNLQNTHSGSPGGYAYLLFKPKNFEVRQFWPFILFLHGVGERGSNPEIVKAQGLPRYLESHPEFPFIVASPQCPSNHYWSSSRLIKLVNDLLEKYPVDRSRVYLTGLSMGGYGAWQLAADYPRVFAAMAPICGGGEPGRVCRMSRVPVWNFHGARDRVVPLSESERMVHALESCGGKVRFTVYPDAEHDAWTRTYDNPELYAWLLSHSTDEEQ